jgi:site-specific DNA-methyltransferase (cytosine-N4-specific)
MCRLLENESVDLILTSPPFALTRQKEYGNASQDVYVDWFMGFASEFYRIFELSGAPR